MLDRAIMTTMVNPGLAGGPLFDARARVAGIVSLGLAAVGRFSLAIPIALFLERRERLERGEVPPPAERRAWLGFYPQASEDGIAVSGVVPGGPAEAAGLQRGDLLVSVDGQAVRGLRQLYDVIWAAGPGRADRHAGAARRGDPGGPGAGRRPLRVLQVRTLVHDARLVAPMDDARSRFPGGYVLVEDDRIVAVGPPPVPAGTRRSTAASTRAARSCCPASSTPTTTCPRC